MFAQELVQDDAAAATTTTTPSKDTEVDEGVEIDLDELLDLEGADARRRFLAAKLDAKRSDDASGARHRLIEQILEKAQTL